MESLIRRPSRRAFFGLGTMTVLAACGHRRGHGGPARRVVSLGPNATETLFALGQGHTVVGVSRYDDFPPDVNALPRVGGMMDPSFEAIVALRPDALVGARGPMQRSVLDRLEAMGVRTLFPPVESLVEIETSIRLYADLVGAPEGAPVLNARIHRRIGHVRDAVRGRTPPGVLAVFGQRPISVAGPGSFADEVIRVAGGRNVVVEGPHWPTLSVETLLALAPEVVLDMTGMEQHGSLREAWSTYTALPAVRDGRMVRLDDPMVMRPGPRVGEVASVFARAIHPGLEI